MLPQSTADAETKAKKTSHLKSANETEAFYHDPDAREKIQLEKDAVKTHENLLRNIQHV